MSTDWQAWYRVLKDHDLDLYRKCIEAGEGVTLKYDLSTKVAADIEAAIIFSVVEALKLQPWNASVSA